MTGHCVEPVALGYLADRQPNIELSREYSFRFIFEFELIRSPLGSIHGQR